MFSSDNLVLYQDDITLVMIFFIFFILITCPPSDCVTDGIVFICILVFSIE